MDNRIKTPEKFSDYFEFSFVVTFVCKTHEYRFRTFCVMCVWKIIRKKKNKK